MTEFYAQPYSLDHTGFYFDSFEKFEAGIEKLNQKGCEEVEIQFIDGEAHLVRLSEAAHIGQGSAFSQKLNDDNLYRLGGLTMAYEYTAIIRKEPETEYWVNCPDLPGCIASGRTEEEAKNNFADAIHFHLVGVKDLHEDYTLPIPRSREEVLAEETGKYFVAYTVVVDEPFMIQVTP